jgi:hypothetical protein
MSFFTNARITLTHLRESINSQYGTGKSSFIKFFYFSMFRINKFIVFYQDCQHINNNKNDELNIARQNYDTLNNFRKSQQLPREFYCDQSYGITDFFLGFWNGKLAYIQWVFHSGTKSRFLRIGDGCAEINYMLTLPEFRKNKICSQVLERSIQTLANDGIKKVFCVIHSKNLASIKSVQRAGMTEYKRLKAIGPFNSRIKVEI